MLSHSQHGLLVCLTQLVLAVLLLCLAVWRLTLQHQLVLTSDWPLYSGVPLLCSGWVDTYLICCCRYYYPGTRMSRQAGCLPVFPINTASIVSRNQRRTKQLKMLLFRCSAWRSA